MPIIVSRYLGGTPKALATGLGCKVSLANPERIRKNPLIINWGTTAPLIALARSQVLNIPDNVELASNKLISLKILSKYGVPTLEWTTDPKCAKEWLEDGSSIVCRKLLRASAGRGIEIVKFAEWKSAGRQAPVLPEAPLYTRYFPKSQEVRIHVAGGKVLHYAQKKKKRGEAADSWVRSHDTGWIFATEGITVNEEACQVALAAVERLHLDFGAADIAIGKRGIAVLEVNSAPGLEGTTLQKYVDFFKSLV